MNGIKVKVTELTSGNSFVHVCKNITAARRYRAFINVNSKYVGKHLKAEIAK